MACLDQKNKPFNFKLNPSCQDQTDSRNELRINHQYPKCNQTDSLENF